MVICCQPDAHSDMEWSGPFCHHGMRGQHSRLPRLWAKLPLQAPGQRQKCQSAYDLALPQMPGIY